MPFEQFRFLVPGVRDVIEILIVAYVLYRVLLFLAGTRALQILFGLIVLGLVYFGALVLKFNMIASLLGYVFTFGVFAAIVVFQPELRHVLSRLGRMRAMQFLNPQGSVGVMEEIVAAVERLSRRGTGAIIAVEGEVSLNDYLESGKEMHAKISADLLTTIFTPYSPLHDGAVMIRGDNIIAAGCVLPLTQFPVEDKSLGTRHRAALGLSEETDAIVIVVSEETSKVSIAIRGLLHRGATPKQLQEVLAGQTWPSLTGEMATDTPTT
ncbi:MAG: diadenylate cyclase CdaA [Gemmatimonadetes bacterium]|nr:diadenylate cyclase CdaA [Gemmatimonadota bacterium]